MDSKIEIEKIYENAIYKLRKLKKERKDIVNRYINELEQRKIKSILNSLNKK
ncbi:MAG: hypothetical protein PHZ07_04975 [Patescibacteria group bacterium]|nr:hypothetical protein [Patescibacteria group bacterium]MDD4304700.1 hypothetical protein [Patescibacteria group bacterium]MDD4695738.1 hypothetical protein [Patescibacteria group bacterium]